jgi:pilus assembly protein CpaE
MDVKMGTQGISSVLICNDPVFRETVRQVMLDPDRAAQLSLELSTPFSGIGAEELGALRAAEPELVFLDLGTEPEVGIRFAQFLAGANPALRFIATGPVLPNEVLIAAMQAGVADYLPKPVTVEKLTETVERAERRLGVVTKRESQAPGQSLAFYGAKGGSGCTTIAANVAIHLHRLTGKKTLLVDLDLELGEIALFLGMQPRFNLVDLVRNFHRMDAELLASYIETHSSGVHLLSAPYQPEPAGSVSGEQIQQILRFLKRHYDYIVVDSSKSLSPATLATFAEMDDIYLIANVDLPSIRNIKRCLTLLEGLAAGGLEKVRLVVNRYNPEGPIALDQVEKSLGLKPYGILRNDYEAVIGSINAGMPLALNGNASPFAKELKGLTARIAGLSTGPERSARPRFSFELPAAFRNLLGRKAGTARHG